MCLYDLTSTLLINIPCTGYNTQENTALSAGARFQFLERAAAHTWQSVLSNIDCMLFCLLQSPLLTVVNVEMFYLSCLHTHKS